jgi:mannose-1-phosphate guanylyltransferase
MYAIVLAGGVGSRLWPRSRNHSPKQFLNLVSERTLLQETLHRLSHLMPLENIIVVTGERYAEFAQTQAPELPVENILTEPAGRGTAPAIGLALFHIKRLAEARGEDDPVIGSFHADHAITKTEAFYEVVRATEEIAQAGYIVTLGILPDEPHTGYGYIQRDSLIKVSRDFPVYHVSRFVEKPPLETAKKYLQTGHYSWNSGMFIWKLSTILNEFKQYQPELTAQLIQIAEAHGKPGYPEVLTEVWNEIKSETIDVGIAEKSQVMAVLPADIGWSDVGDWAQVCTIVSERDQNEEGNAISAFHIGIDTKNSMIWTADKQKLIATVGLEDVIIIDTGDVLMVCNRHRNQEVKKVVEQLKKQQLDKYL